ncbi:hypothetical protein PG996_008124 [Apiospora saccharicola]|uniref:Cyanovirin-N domain-containing protein n=1 Tax=Apiospora saccharicola TaxID=335842 RepID=A0ABR1UXP7_9PEZI
MKMFTQILALLALFLGVVVGDFPPYGSPGDLQCTDIQMGDDHSVKAKCPVYQPDKLYLCSQMDLNHCYANQDGRLEARENGNFGSSCNNCRMYGTVLQCNCEISPGSGSFVTTSVDTNDVILNQNGNLNCFLQLGWECQMW